MRTLLWLLAAAPLAFAQLDNDTITVTATRQANVAPDQAVVAVTVNAPATVALDDILALLGSAGITVSDLSGIGSTTGILVPAGNPVSTQWFFTKAIGLTRLNAVLAALGSAAQAGTAKMPPIAISYYVQSSATSDAQRAAYPCVLPSLLSDAQRQAQNIASAAGVRVGSIVAMADSGGLLQGVIGIPTVASWIGDFSQLVGSSFYSVNSFLFQSVSPPPCTMTVQFRIVR
jgi:hypothetical protein